MRAVPRRVVESYHVRFGLEARDAAVRGTSLTDAIDLHAHAQPGTEDPLDMAKRASAANMGGVVFKSLIGGAQACQQVQDAVNHWAEAAGLRPVQCFYGVMTDRDFTPAAVRRACEDGAKVVWLPVIGSAHSLHRVGAPRRVLRDTEGLDGDEILWPLPWEEALRRGKYLLDEHGRLKPAVAEMLHIAADHGVATSFAHSSKPEMEALAEECQRMGYRQAFIDHPYGPQIGLEFEDLPAFARAGVTINFTYDEISPLLGVDPKDMMDTIKAIGPAHFTFSSDGGNPLLPNAVESLLTLVRYAYAYGLEEADLRQITVDNPRRVLGLAA